MGDGIKKIGVLFLLAAALGIVILGLGPLRDRLTDLNMTLIVDWLRSLGLIAVLIGGGLIILQAFLPIFPFIGLVTANVLVFGLVGGFFINWTSSVLASILMFYLARSTGREWAEKKLSRYPKWTRINDFLQANGFKSILTLRLFPIIPPVALNLLSGISKVGARSYVAATSLGKIPAILLQSMIGNDLLSFSENKTRILLLAVGFGLVLFIGMKVVRKKMKLS
ncbi:TVP38/TMEM64 family protein [Ammoniphilus sp. YIM 78166]|uniref:TVP38/TMEM64 family protein n=1 Tax=Ammoniphilus sp. YIM 78166 TaxID=1644106 RepID=UPI00106F98AC|nr:TVP38/TMEM64 family protein [Ammoniphilus sp. YIM 78166]